METSFDASAGASEEKAPLYLFSRSGVSVELDGPALKIQLVHEKAQRHIPMCRLSRILTDHKTQFSTEALLACAGRGITILFVGRDSSIGARLLGRPGERQEMRQRMLDLMQRANWKDRYRQWRHTVERATRARMQKKLRIPAQYIYTAQLNEWIDKRGMELSDLDTARNTRLWLRHPAQAWMLNHANQLGLGADSELLLDGWPDLVGDLTCILYWHLEPIRFGWLRRRYLWKMNNHSDPSPVTRRDMVNLYEKNASVVSRHGREITNQLHVWLIDNA